MAKNWKAIDGLALVASLIFAVGVRLYGLGRESLWLDEATSLMLARMDIPTLVHWTALDIHPPLYYILLHFWVSLGESEAVLRGLSVLAGVLNVLVIYALGRELFDRRTGLFAAALLALAPLHVWYSQETRMYAWVTLWSSLSVLLALKVWQKGHWGTWLAYVLATAAGLYTHYYAIFAILVENLFFLYLLCRRRVGRGHLWRWLAAQGAVFVLFLPWFPIFLLPITVGGGGWVALGLGRPGVSALVQTLVLYLVGTGRELYPPLLRRLGYGLAMGLLLWGICPWAKERKAQQSQAPYSEWEAVLFTLGYFALPLGLAWGASQVFKPMYSARYMLPFLIPFLLLVARGVTRVPWALGRALLLISLLVVLGFGVWAQVQKLDKPPWRALAEELIAQSHPGDLVLFMPGWHAKPFDYYARGRLALYSDVPIPVERYGAQALAAVERAVRGHPRVWFVWEEGHYTDPQGRVYAYLKAHYRQEKVIPIPALRGGKIILFVSSQALGGGSNG
ncbi:MAG: glycosyltransferase family 39 protein [Anaerolineae bacterium]|nr:glycosyltransferase family 39 protein [Anaerolineae bacterium]